jgi:hypothetical protein
MLILVPLQIKNLTSTAQDLALQESSGDYVSSGIAIEAGEDFDRDVNGTGRTEAWNGYF